MFLRQPELSKPIIIYCISSAVKDCMFMSMEKERPTLVLCEGLAVLAIVRCKCYDYLVERIYPSDTFSEISRWFDSLFLSFLCASTNSKHYMFKKMFSFRKTRDGSAHKSSNLHQLPQET